MFRQSGLLQRFVRGVAGFAAVIDREISLRQRTKPNFVISPARPHEDAARAAQEFNYFLIESRQSSRGSWCWCWCWNTQHLFCHQVNRNFGQIARIPIQFKKICQGTDHLRFKVLQAFGFN